MSKSFNTKSKNPNQSNDLPNYTIRRLGAGLALTGALGASVLGAHAAADVLTTPNSVVHTVDEYDHMKHVTVTVEPGKGAEAVIRSVEPALLENAELRAEVVSYITKQGANTAKDGTHELVANQAVEVPLVSGYELQLPDTR